MTATLCRAPFQIGQDVGQRPTQCTHELAGLVCLAFLTNCENFGGDYRRDTKARPALLWCSECEQESIAEWIPARYCHGHGNQSGIYIQDDYNQTSGEFMDGSRMRCPYCGADGKIHSATAMNHGYTNQGFITVPKMYRRLVNTKFSCYIRLA